TQVEQLTSELSNEKSNAASFEMSKQSLEKQNRDLKSIISDLESQLKAKSKNAMLESKLSSLQEQLDAALRDKSLIQKSLRRAEKKAADNEAALIGELTNASSLKDQLDKANSRFRAIKNQVNDHEEEIDRLGSAKRKLQTELDDERDTSEALSLEINKLRSMSRLTTSTQRSKNMDDAD
ncbi:hypothetical protein MXB_2691, partial [Myxobolus squamalis]